MRKAGCGRSTPLLTALLLLGATILPNLQANVARAAEPIRLGMTMALTGGVAPAGKQVLTALQIWRDDVNANGGLLGRPVELVFYDDQSNPQNVPALYTKLIEVDKVDLLIGPYATNMVAPAISVLMQYKKTTIGIMANAANSKFHYDQYFSILPTGPEPQKAFCGSGPVGSIEKYWSLWNLLLAAFARMPIVVFLYCISTGMAGATMLVA